MIRWLALILLLVSAGSALASGGFSVQNLTPATVDSRTTLVAANDVFAERDGDLHAAWIQGSDGVGDVYYYRFNNASGRWLAGVPLTQGAQASNVSISGDYLGNIHCVWEDATGIFHSMWNVTSEEWSEPELVSRDGSSPIVICDGTPNVHVLWIQRGTGGRSYLAHRYRDPYGNWTQIVAVTPKEGRVSDISATIDDRNGLHVALEMELESGKGFDLYYVHRRAGREWDPYRRIAEASGGEIHTPSLAVDDDGFVHVLWVQGDAGQSKIFSRSWRGGWEEAKVLINSPAASNPYISSDEDGNLHLVWIDAANDTAGGQAVYYRRYWKIGVWSYPGIVSDRTPADPVCPPRVVVSPRTQNVNILWTESRGKVGTVMFAKLLGERRLDVLRAASRAQTSLGEIRNHVLHSRKAEDRLKEAEAAFDEGVELLRKLDPGSALSRFKSCVELVDQAQELEDAYKESYGKRMGAAFAAAGLVVAVLILCGWAIARRRQT